MAFFVGYIPVFPYFVFIPVIVCCFIEIICDTHAVDGVIEGCEGVCALDSQVLCDGYGIEDGGAGAFDVVGFIVDTHLIPLFWR